MADKTNVYNQIAALRRETAKNAVSPNSLGAILKSIVDLIDGTVNNTQLDTGGGDNVGGSQSHGFNGLVEDDTFSPLVVSNQTVQLQPQGSCTLTYNRLADEVVLGAYDENLISVVVQDGTITIVAASLEGATNFTLSDENGSVSVAVAVAVGDVSAPEVEVSEVERLLASKQDRVVGVAEEMVPADYLHGCGLTLERSDMASPLVAVQSGGAGELSQCVYLEAGYTVRAYRQTANPAYVSIDIVRIYGEVMEAGEIAAPMASADTGNLEVVVPASGYYAFSGLSEIDYITKEVDVTVEEVLAMKQDKENGKGLSTNDYTNADKNKLAALPGSAYSKSEIDQTVGNIIAILPGSYTQSATDISLTAPDDAVPLITLPSATTSYAGVMSAADKQYLDSVPGLLADKQDKLPLSTSSGLTDNLKLSAGNNQASAHFTIALGYSNVVSGESGAALGSRNQVTKSAGFAAGYRNACQGEVAATIGEMLKTQNRGEVALGKFNTTTTGQVFSIGCGTSDSDRKNAVVVDANGLVSFPQHNTSVSDILTSVTNAKGIIPTDISRSQTDATFVHVENGVQTALFYLRQATSSLAGLMTAGDKVKLDALPTNASLQSALNGKANTSDLKAENIAADYRAMNNQPYTTVAAALAKIANDIADFEVRIAALEGNT